MMNIKSEDKLKILQYKFIYEEDIQVAKEYEAGSIDLNYRLSFFRDKLSNESKTEQSRYDKIFNIKKNIDLEDINLLTIDDKNQIGESAKKPSTSIKSWAKIIYKKIILATHPDKTKGISSQYLMNQLTEKYLITQNAYTNKIYSDLIMVAFDLNIEIPENVINEEIQISLDVKQNNIKQKRQMLGWQWFHVPDKQKDKELKKILTRYGFKFTEDQIKDVIKRKYVKRKVGTRPEKLSSKRRKKLE